MIKRKTSKHRAGKVSMIILIIIALLAAAVFGAWNLLRNSGYRNLYDKWRGKAPTLNIGQLEEGESIDIGWQDGWIRYENKVYAYNENIITCFIMGTDKDDQMLEESSGFSGGQSDANFLLVLNPDKQIIQIVCINRDTMTDIAICDVLGNYTGTIKGQLATQHAYGKSTYENAENTVKAVENIMYGLPIHCYCAVKMDAIGEINDAVGGVTVKCLEDLTRVNWRFTVGNEVKLQGKQAYDYVHYRDIKVFESARGRLARQKQYLSGFIGQAKAAMKKNPTIAVSLFNSLTNYMTTDLSVDEVAYLASTAAGYKFDTSDIYTLEGTTRQGDIYEEFYPDEEALQQLIIELFYEEVQQ